MKKKVFSIIKILLVLLGFILSGVFIDILKRLDILPDKYYWFIIIVLIIFNIIGIIGLYTKKRWTKVISIIIYIIITIINIVGIDYANNTISFLDNGFNNNTMEVSKYDIVVLKDSKYNKLKNLDSKKMGYLNNDPQTSKYIAIIKNKVNTELIKYQDVYDLYESLINKEIDSILVDEAYLDILEDKYEDLDINIKVIDSFVVEAPVSINNNKKKKSLDPINIYITGSDSRSGDIANKSRSDVNMIVTVNPKTKTIMLTSIPRDYYVKLHGTDGLNDKLTHSGMYGVDMSKKTVEDLFGIDIDYTIKVSFSSVVEVVDLVGGIEIESDTSFTTTCSDGGAKKVKVKKGMNHFNGAEALSYARERYAYKEGDRHRIQNQQQVLEAIISKISTNKALLLKYDEFLTKFSKLYRTDISEDVIKVYIKEQLDDMSDWKIEKQTVDGNDAMKETYTMPGRELYVMEPDSDSVNKANENINRVLKGD